MKKILFYDAYKHTEMVLNGKITVTARLIKHKGNLRKVKKDDNYRYFNDGEHGWCQLMDDATRKIIEPWYRPGSVVAISQSYDSIKDTLDDDLQYVLQQNGGWTGKMLVSSAYMPNHIEITNVEYKHFQDLTEDEILQAGITKDGDDYCFTEARKGQPEYTYRYKTAKEAFAEMIDGIAGHGTWERNRVAVVYKFKLIDYHEE